MKALASFVLVAVATALLVGGELFALAVKPIMLVMMVLP